MHIFLTNLDGQVQDIEIDFDPIDEKRLINKITRTLDLLPDSFDLVKTDHDSYKIVLSYRFHLIQDGVYGLTAQGIWGIYISSTTGTRHSDEEDQDDVRNWIKHNCPEEIENLLAIVSREKRRFPSRESEQILAWISERRREWTA